MENHHPVQAKFLNPATPPRLFTLIVIAGVSALSMNMFLPSLPSMTDYFGADYALMQLSISAYLAVTGVMQLFLGPLSDRFGRRRVLICSFAFFVLATLGCIFAPTAELFLVFRMLQAAVATGMVLSRAIVRDMVSAERAASMMGYLAMGMAVAPMAGPMVGGVLEEAFGWQANFVFMLAAGALTLCLIWFDLGETNMQQSRSMMEQLRKYPGLFSSRRFWGYTLSGAFASGMFFAFLGGAPYVGDQVMGVAPSELGIYFGIISLGYMAGNFFSGRFSERIGINRMILLGLVIAGFAMVAALVTQLSGVKAPLGLFGYVIFVGFGNGLTLPNAQAGMLSVRADLAGSASGLGGTVMIGGGAIISAVTGALLGPETGPYPLIYMMLGSALSGIVTILYVVRREAELARQSAL